MSGSPISSLQARDISTIEWSSGMVEYPGPQEKVLIGAFSFGTSGWLGCIGQAAGEKETMPDDEGGEVVRW